jgi:hypothetical protein
MSKIARSLRSIYKKYIAGKPAEFLSMKQWAKQHEDQTSVKTWLKGKKDSQKGPKGHAPYAKKKSGGGK